MPTNSELLNFLQRYPICSLGSLKSNCRRQNCIVCNCISLLVNSFIRKRLWNFYPCVIWALWVSASLAEACGLRMLLVTTLLSVIRVFLFSVINCVIHVVNHVSFVIICPNWDRVRGWIKVDDGLKLMRLMTVSRAVHSVQGFFSAVRYRS